MSTYWEDATRLVHELESKHGQTFRNQLWRKKYLADYDIIGEFGEIDWPMCDEECVALWDVLIILVLERLADGAQGKDLRDCPYQVVDWPSYYQAMMWAFGPPRFATKWSKHVGSIAEGRK